MTRQNETGQDDSARDDALIRALSRLPEPEVPEGLAARIVAHAIIAPQPEPIGDRRAEPPVDRPTALPKPRILRRQEAAAPPARRALGRWSLMAASVAAVVLVASSVGMLNGGENDDIAASGPTTGVPDAAQRAQRVPAPSTSQAPSPATAPVGQQADRNLTSPPPSAAPPGESPQSQMADNAQSNAPSADATQLARDMEPDGPRPGVAPGVGNTVSAQAGPPAPGPDALSRARGVYGPPAPSAFGITGGIGPRGGDGSPIGGTNGQSGPGPSSPGSARPGPRSGGPPSSGGGYMR